MMTAIAMRQETEQDNEEGDEEDEEEEQEAEMLHWGIAVVPSTEEAPVIAGKGLRVFN